MSALTQYLADVTARGLRVIEHSLYGGVTPGLHMPGSMHVKVDPATGQTRAADINYGPPGSPPEERLALLWACRLADAAGLNVIYTPHRVHPIAKTAENHRDHLHVDDGPIAAYKAPGRNDALYARILAERPTTQEDDMFNDADRALLRKLAEQADRDKRDRDKMKAALERLERDVKASRR